MISKTLFNTAFAVGLVNGLAHLPPRVANLQSNLGHDVDPAFSNQFYSDGGAGGKVGGYNWITLSDGRVGNSYPIHVSYAAYGTRNASDPTQYTIVGDHTKKPPSYHYGTDGSNAGVIIADPSDTDQGNCFGPGPNTAMVRIPGNSTGGVTVWTVYNACVNPPAPRYNTFVEFNTVNPDTLNQQNKNLPAQRTVLRLFNSGTEPLYGTDDLATDGNWYFMMALDNGGYKLARVKIADRNNRSAYQSYYPAQKVWNSTVHKLGDASTNTYTPPAIGSGIFGTDLYYSTYFQTWLLTDSASDAYGAKYLQVAYSTSGIPEGPYKDAGTLFKPTTDADCQKLGNEGNSYLVHSQPGWDESGATLLVSWISCNTFTKFRQDYLGFVKRTKCSCSGTSI